MEIKLELGGKKPDCDNPNGDKPAKDDCDGEQPDGEQLSDNKSDGDNLDDDKPIEDDDGERSDGKKSAGKQPVCKILDGDKPANHDSEDSDDEKPDVEQHDDKTLAFEGLDKSEKEDRAVYVPSNTFKHLMSSVFNCYVSLNGQALNLPLDTSTVAHLRTPKSDNLGFTAQFKFFPFQYSVLKIKIFASGVPELEGEAAGTMIIKGVSMESCEHQSYSDESSGAAGSSSTPAISAVSGQLKQYCATIEEAKVLPEEIVKFTTTCRIINVSVHDEVRNLLNNNEATAALGALLGQIRDTAHADGSKTVNLVFHASTGELDYIRAICGAMQAASQRDNDDKRNPFVRFFKKSPNALLYHHGNAVKPDQKGFEKEKFVTLETFDCFDTPREHLFTTIQGKMCAWWTQEENAESLRKVEFKARAVELEYSRGRLFHLSVKAPDDGTYLPSKRDICYVRLRGVTRVMPEVERIVDPEATAELIFRVSFDALAAMDIETYIRSRCQEFFNPEQLTDEMVDEIKFGPTEASCDRKARIKSLVTKWAQEGYLAITEKTSPASTELADKCEWWRAQRISTVLPGTPPGSVSFLVTLPLVPKSEGPKTGLASMINVQFPILKWDTVKVTGSRDVSLGKFIEDHFADEETELTVLFRKVLSDQSTRRAIFALNDLCCPQIADEKFPVSEQSIRTYRYLQNFRNGETGNVFEKFPHMENILTNPEQVPEHLRRCWENMDITKQEAYRGLANITQNIHWIAGVAGTGKSNLLQFIVLMAMLGDKNKEHPIKVLDLLPRNKAVSDFANEMAAAFEELGKKNAVIRLRSFESEIDDWISTRVLGEDRQDLINEEEAKWAWAELGDESVIQNQLAQLATSIHDERAQTTKYSSFSLQQQAHSFLEAHKENFPRLRGALDELAKQGLGDDEVDMISDMKVLVTHLYAVFLKQFTGVIVATPGSGCHSNLVRNFKADIVMIDDASCVGEAEFLMAIRYHNPKFFVVVGDPNQPGHFVHESYDRPVTNPFTEFLKRSPLERALSYGGVVKSQLASNHRGKNDLSALASKIIYHRSLLPAAQGEAAWSPETPAWCEWLRKHCPTLIHGHQRILLELQGAVASKVGTSSINMAHIEHACTLVVQAIQDDKLKGMNGKKVTVLVATFYMAQKAKYAELFDELVFRKTLTHQQRRQIDVRTVDDAQGFAADLVIVDFVKTSSPGFTCDRRRLCVAITRARQAEIILMSRGMFIGRKPSPEDPTGHDVRLLAKIYTEVALTRGIVTKSVAPMPKKTTETVAGGDRAAADHGLVPNVIKCYNCGKSGHGQRECLKPLNHVKTGHKAKGHSNLKQSGHPKAARKQKDGQKTRADKEAIVCHRCREQGHKKIDCPTHRCGHCGKDGHHKLRCPDKDVDDD